MKDTEAIFEPQAKFTHCVPQAVGITRTADTTPYSNVISESA